MEEEIKTKKPNNLPKVTELMGAGGVVLNTI